MACDIALGRASHDLVIDDSGNLILIDNAERVAQQIKVTLLTLFGEYFLNTSFGVPYLDKILVKAPQRSVVESVLRAAVTAVPDVRRVIRLKLQQDGDTREAVVTVDAETAFGLVNRSVLLNG